MARRSGGKGRWGEEGGSGMTRQRPPEAARALRRPAADRGDRARRGRWSRAADMWAPFDGSVDFSESLVSLTVYIMAFQFP